MKCTYKYVRVGRYLLCLEQNLLHLIWHVIFKYQSFQLNSHGVSRKQGLKWVGLIASYRIGVFQPDTLAVNLPVFGQYAIAVHRGYKVFNFSEMTVSKVFHREVVKELIQEEIDNVTLASCLPFAPEIIQIGKEEKWYKEEYFPGRFLINSFKDDSCALIKVYCQEVEIILKYLLRFKGSSTKMLGQYLQNIVGEIESLCKKNSKPHNVKLHNIVKIFIQSVTSYLREYNPYEVQLSFSHGDFCLLNIIQTHNGLRVIDWEGASYRSKLYDFYNFFFTELYYSRVDFGIKDAMEKMLYLPVSITTSGQQKSSDEFSRELTLYRWLFYIERIKMLLEREWTDGLLKVIRHSIDIFQQFDKIKLHS